MAYGDLDYDPVGVYDDEDELRRNGGYAPVIPPSAPAPPEVLTPSPGVSSRAGDELAPPVSSAGSEAMPSLGVSSRPEIPILSSARPQWQQVPGKYTPGDYAPAEPHGWAKFGHIMAGLNPVTNAFFNARPQEHAQEAYKNASAEYEAPINDQEKEALTDEAQARADALRHPATKQESEGKTVTTDQGVFQWNPATSRYDVRVGGAPAKNEKPDSLDQQYNDAIASGDHATAARILKVKEDMAAAGRNPEEGTWQIAEDQDGKPVLFNSKSGQMKAAPAGVAKAGTHAKAATELEKQQQPYKDILDSVEEARDYAKEKSGPGDYALLLRVVDATKPAKGFRFTQSEQDLLIGARSLANSADALYQKAAGGQLLTDDQRKQMLDVLNIVEKHAQQRMKDIGGGATQKFTDNGVTYNIPAGQVDEFKKDHPNAK
jgi:hypothetical protein